MNYPWTVSLVIIAMLLNIGCVSKEKVRSSSTLYSEFSSIRGLTDHPQARERALEEIPIGSSENQIKDFIEENFSGGLKSEHEIPEKYIPKELRALNYICVRSDYYGVFLIAENWTEVVFFLDKNRNLKDVIVASSGVSL